MPVEATHWGRWARQLPLGSSVPLLLGPPLVGGLLVGVLRALTAFDDPLAAGSGSAAAAAGPQTEGADEASAERDRTAAASTSGRDSAGAGLSSPMWRARQQVPALASPEESNPVCGPQGSMPPQPATCRKFSSQVILPQRAGEGEGRGGAGAAGAGGGDHAGQRGLPGPGGPLRRHRPLGRARAGLRAAQQDAPPAATHRGRLRRRRAALLCTGLRFQCGW